MPPKFEGKITIPTGGWDLTVGEDSGAQSDTVTIAAGDYYLTTSSSLLTAVKNALDASGTLLGTYTVTLADSGTDPTGAVSIAVSGGATTCAVTTWDDTDLRDALGFSGTTSYGATVTGDYQAKYLWLPNTGRTGKTPNQSTASDNMGTPVVDFSSVIAPSGKSYRVSWSRRYTDEWLFPNVTGRKMWQVHETNVNESYESFYETVVSVGLPWRYHWDRSDDTVYWPGFVVDAETIRHEIVYDSLVGSKGLWNLTLSVAKYV